MSSLGPVALGRPEVDAGPRAIVPRVTLAICSRNRPDDLRRAVLASLAVLPADGELLVIEQSADPTPDVGGCDSRVRYHHRPGRGVSIARNLALELATSDVVVFTDDDCVPRSGMVDRLAKAFERRELAVAFGTVVAHGTSDGFVASYAPRRPRLLLGRFAKLSDGGIGACMALRREAAIALGGFDERLGPGTVFAANEEGELAFRALRDGYALAHVPEAVVDHLGARPWSQGREYSFQTYCGIAAAYSMHARSGDVVAALLIVQQLLWVGRSVLWAVLRTGRPSGLSALRGLGAGVRRGMGLRPIRQAQRCSRG